MQDSKLRKSSILLTPGPVTTSESVRSSMLEEWGTWDADYLALTEAVRSRLRDLSVKPHADYTSVLIPGSGTYAVESVISSLPPGLLAVFTNGVYGERMVEIARRYQIPTLSVTTPDSEPVTADLVRKTLAAHTDIRYVGFVHCETTTGLLNPLEELVDVAKGDGKTVLVDAVSSFAGYPIAVDVLEVDALMTTANKCLQGVPGVGIVIASTSFIESLSGHARTVSLDLYDQWHTMQSMPGKWRFTSPTQSVQALGTALDELDAEGGVAARAARYARNHEVLVNAMNDMKFHTYIAKPWQSHVITTFLHPSDRFDFQDFYAFTKAAGFLIYPGKLTHTKTFRIGTIGDINEEVMREFVEVVENYWRKERN